MAGQLRFIGDTDLGTLVMQTWDSTLRVQSTPADIFGALQGIYREDLKYLPDGIITKLPFKKGIYKHTMALLMNLNDDGVNGRTDQEGQEETQTLKHFTAYSQDYSHAVNTEQYGIDAHSKAGYNILKAVTPQLSTWHREKEGLKKRQALLEKYDDDLTAAPTSLTQHWNSHILIKGCDVDTEQPSYSPTLATYTEAIGDAMNVGTTTDWDITFLTNIGEFLSMRWEIEPAIDNRYMVTVPGYQSSVLKDMGTSDTLPRLRRDTYVKEIAGQAWKGYLGSYQNIDLFEDPRAPVLVLTGQDAAWVVTSYYRKMGTTDDRPTSGTRFDVGYGLGKSSILVAEHEKLHYETELKNYGKRKGVGAFRGMACSNCEYDIVTESTTSRRNQSSAVILGKRVARDA
jgi:hypothetical protein